MWRQMFTGPVAWQPLLLALASTLVLAWGASRLARRALIAAIRILVHDTVALASPLVRAPLRLTGLAVFLLVFGTLIVPALELVGVHPRAGIHLGTVTQWLFDSGLRVILIVAVAYALMRVVHLMVQRFEHDLDFGTGLDGLERAKRARTLGSVLTNLATVAIALVALLMILREFNLDIAPVLTGAGVVGVALGFGAQTLVRDLIAGFFLILENQVRVGDVVSIDGTGGLVEAINLRTIVIRNEEGTVYVVPNGSITTLANLSKDYAYYVISLPVAYGEDTDALAAQLRRIGADLQADDRFGPSILAPIEVLGIDGFDESNLRLKLRIKTAPLKQWDVGRELRRRIARTLQEDGVQMWSPQRTFVVPPPAPPKGAQ